MHYCPFSEEELDEFDGVSNPMGDYCNDCENTDCEHNPNPGPEAIDWPDLMDEAMMKSGHSFKETVVISSNPDKKIRMHCGKAGKTIDLRESSPGKVECSMCGELVLDNFVSMIEASKQNPEYPDIEEAVLIGE